MNKRFFIIVFAWMVAFMFLRVEALFAKEDKWERAHRIKWETKEKEKKGQEETKKKAEKLREENTGTLKKAISKNMALNEAQKRDLADYFAGQYKEKIDEKESAEDIAAFDKITENSNLNQVQKKAALKKYLDDKTEAEKKAVKEKAQKEADKLKAEKGTAKENPGETENIVEGSKSKE